jgi:hypothetical protein
VRSLATLAAAVGASPHAATLAGKVLKTMFWTKVKTAAAVVVASATAIGGGVGIIVAQAEEAPTQEQSAEQSLNAKLMRSPRPQLGFSNWDILDYPQKTKGTLRLENAFKPDGFVDVGADWAGRTVVLVEFNLSTDGWHDADLRKEAVADYIRLSGEYTPKGVVVAGVWCSGGGRAQRGVKTILSRDEMIVQAKAFVETHKLPGPIYLEAPPETKTGKNQKAATFRQFTGIRSCNLGGGNVVCVLRADGKVVYRGWESKGFGYHTTRLMLDRLLDADFDQAVRREFFPEKARELPQIQKRENGLVYSDDFESYTDNHAFKLEPRWGFAYARQSRLDLRPDVVAAVGRNGSRAAFVNTAPHGYNATYGLAHTFPAPLRNGHVRFHIRRQDRERQAAPLSNPFGLTPQRLLSANPRRAMCVRVGRPGSYDPAGMIMATGAPGKETFVVGFRLDKPGPVKMSAKSWHEVTILCRPGEKALVKVDGQDIGRLDSEVIDSIGYRFPDAGSRFYVDDIELFYAGNATDTLAAHRAAQPKSVTPVEPFTEAEQKVLLRPVAPVVCGAQRAELPAGAIPRADLYNGALTWSSHPYYSFDHPLDLAGPLVMENVLKRGEFVDVLKKYEGKIIYVFSARGSRERDIRSRALVKSVVTFNRNQRLVSEYRPRGIVTVGVSVDVGHRMTVCTPEELAWANCEPNRFIHALMEECKIGPLDVPTARLHEMFDDVLVEIRPNQPKMLCSTFRGDGYLSTFSGTHTFLLNKEGKIVFRGQGSDGHTYWRVKVALDRLLDDDFEAAVRQEFRNPDLRHYKTPLLPIAAKRADGLAYADDFESYKDAYDVSLQPRWGFHYQRMSDRIFMFPPYVYKGEGRNGSTAILLQKMYNADAQCGNKTEGINIRHSFPQALTDGHFRLFVRRGPRVPRYGEPALFRVGVTGIGADGKPIDGSLTTFGKWKKEQFVLTPSKEFLAWDGIVRTGPRPNYVNKDNIKPTGVAMSDNNWHEIRYVCKPGQNVQIQIDGKTIGELPTESLSAVQVKSETWSTIYVDDVELFYAGDAEALTKAHHEWLKSDLTRLQTEWSKEADKWEAKVKKLRRR